jgi:hypothetical protein
MDQLAGLTEEIRKLFRDRFRLLQPHLEDYRPLKLVAEESEIPFRTAQRWVALISQGRFGRVGAEESSGSRRAPSGFREDQGGH